MILTTIASKELFTDCLDRIRQETENLTRTLSVLETRKQRLTERFNSASTALETIGQLTALVPETSAEIRETLEAIFTGDNPATEPIHEVGAIEESPSPVSIEAIDRAVPVSDVGEDRPLALIRVARQLLPGLEEGRPVTNAALSRAMTENFGGSDAEGCWLWKDAYEALEVSQILWVNQHGQELFDRADRQTTRSELERIHRLCPTHTKRSETSIRLQQFSTPLPLAYIARVAARLTPDDLVLEPSAGTGILAVFAQIGGVELILNEICPERRGILKEIFPNSPLSGHDAEAIDDYLDRRYRPTVVIMNPPFSASPKMGKRNAHATYKHLSSALARLSEGGRLVAITANWFSPLNHEWRESFTKMQRSARLVFSCPIAGNAYTKHGTAIETRLTVFDKVASDNPDEFINCFDSVLSLPTLLDYVGMFIPQRQALAPIVEKETLPKPLVTAIEIPRPAADSIIGKQLNGSKRQRSIALEQKSAIHPAISPDEIIELNYSVRERGGSVREISDSLYETYELQAIEIEEAVEHPSPLVQSVAMASIDPPVPTYRPLLPKRLISGGILSNAQLESVIHAGESHGKFLEGNYQVDDTLDLISIAPSGSPDTVRFRRGYFIGDSTGVGKGRQVSAILLDNLLQGRKKALWISKSDTLLEDARRDWTALGGNPDHIVPLT